MKIFVLLGLLIGLHPTCCAQTLLCTGADSVLAMYRDDADRISIAKTFQNGSTWMDSTTIDPDLAQTAMSALVAVYNSSSPQRDSVVDLLDIHIYPLIPLRTFSVRADSSMDWVHQLEMGITPTGEATLDSLMQTYGMSASYSWSWPSGGDKVFSFTTGSNLNLLPMVPLFEQVPGVVYCSVSGSVGDGDRITDSVYTDHVEITYSYGWGDCPAGCGGFYSWVFSVLPDCSVEFLYSYGQSPFTPTQVAEIRPSSQEAWPVPANTTLYLSHPIKGGQGMLFGPDGRMLGRPKVIGAGIDVSGLQPGTYLLKRGDRPSDVPLRFEVIH